jgi:pimeloyl-ACP methyl ester carboxylesterase
MGRMMEIAMKRCGGGQLRFLHLVGWVVVLLPLLGETTKGSVPTSRAGQGTVQSKAAPGPRGEEKQLTFPGHGVTLAGTLLIPPAPAGTPRGAKRPAVLLVGEEGTTNRDGVTVGKATHLIYREIAEGLAAEGIVSLRFDPRCQGASECRPPQSFDDLIDDTHAALQFLGAQAGIDAKRLVLLGHGGGGYLSMCLLSQKENVAAGLILVNTSGRTLGKMVREEFQARLREEGRPQAEISRILAKSERITRRLAYGTTDFASENLDPRDPYDAELLRRIDQHPLVVSLLVNDPLQIISAARVPIFLLQGEKDLRVTTRDLGFLEDALSRTNHPDFTKRTLPTMDHWLKATPGDPSFVTEQDATRPLEKDLLAAILEWWTPRFATRKP